MNRQIFNKFRMNQILNKRVNSEISKKLLKLDVNKNKVSKEKMVYFIRNARSYNNLVYNPIDKRSYDSVLTPEGKIQCYEFRNMFNLDVDIVYTSPLVRSLQTTDLIFKDKKKVVIEDLVGYPMCGKPDYKRLHIDSFKKRFNSFNFDNFNPKQDIWENSVEDIYKLKERIDNIHNFIINSKEKNIAIVSQNSFLIWFVFMKNKSKYPLIEKFKYCRPYNIKI